MYLEPWHADVLDFLELRKCLGQGLPFKLLVGFRGLGFRVQGLRDYTDFRVEGLGFRVRFVFLMYFVFIVDLAPYRASI